MSKLKSSIFRYFLAIVIIIVLLFCLSGTYSYKDIGKLGYVVALAIDKGSSNNLKLTIQLASHTSSSGSESSSQSSSSVFDSVECSSVDSGINLFNSYISRNITLSHCKVIVISEEVASNDISKYIYDLCNNPEVSSHANLMVTKCDASSFLQMSHPALESFSARYYEIAPVSSKYTGYTKAISLIDFFSSYVDTYREPTAILGNINTDTTHISDASVQSPNKDNSYVAGETPMISDNKVECMGIAVFKGGKIVGELNGIESICHMIVSGELTSCNVRIQNPDNKDQTLDVKLELEGKPKYKIDFVNNYPYIEADINLNARATSIVKDCDFLEEDKIKQLQNCVTVYMKKEIMSYLYKMSKTYNSDIDGFGRYAVSKFSTINEWNDYSWLNNFQNSFFKVNVSTKVRSGYNFIST